MSRRPFKLLRRDVVCGLEYFVGDPRPPPFHAGPVPSRDAVRVPFPESRPADAEVLGERDLLAFANDLPNSEAYGCRHGY